MCVADPNDAMRDYGLVSVVTLEALSCYNGIYLLIIRQSHYVGHSTDEICNWPNHAYNVNMVELINLWEQMIVDDWSIDLLLWLYMLWEWGFSEIEWLFSFRWRNYNEDIVHGIYSFIFQRFFYIYTYFYLLLSYTFHLNITRLLFFFSFPLVLCKISLFMCVSREFFFFEKPDTSIFPCTQLYTRNERNRRGEITFTVGLIYTSILRVFLTVLGHVENTLSFRFAWCEFLFFFHLWMYDFKCFYKYIYFFRNDFCEWLFFSFLDWNKLVGENLLFFYCWYWFKNYELLFLQNRKAAVKYKSK